MIGAAEAARLLACVDSTLLDATASDEATAHFCHRTAEAARVGLRVAAVCVYPQMVAAARGALGTSGVKLAAVAGAFPHGQLPLDLRCAEVRRVVADGADEVDVVISRALILAGRVAEARAEVEAMKAACEGRTLKVILESGELPTPALREAAMAAMQGGADFIKTSTGKSATGATPEAAHTMMQAIRDYVNFNKRMVGFKVSGGVRTPEQAALYASIAEKYMGEEYVSNKTFRIGASSLVEGLAAILTF